MVDTLKIKQRISEAKHLLESIPDRDDFEINEEHGKVKITIQSNN
jgi:hypothetical protein